MLYKYVQRRQIQFRQDDNGLCAEHMEDRKNKNVTKNNQAISAFLMWVSLFLGKTASESK